MKQKIKITLIAILLLFPVSVLAEGNVSVSPDSLTIEQGESVILTITAYNTIGDVTIKSNNNDVASVNIEEWETGIVEEKETKTCSITVTGNNVGITTITLTIDAATFDEQDLSGQTKTIAVNVLEKSNVPGNDNDQDQNIDNPKTGNKIIIIFSLFVLSICGILYLRVFKKIL